MKTVAIRIGLLATALTLAGCASLAPPKRPAYTGADSVTSASASQLVGTWRVSDLNPYPDAEPQDTTIEYLSDGSVRGTVIPRGESMAMLGETTFEFTGRYQVNGDTVVHQDVEMSADSDNPMVGMIANMINSRQGISGQANIYELSSNRIVMVGEDGGAMEYLRQ